VDGVVTGSLARTGKGSWVINLNIVAARDGRTIGSASTRVKDDDALLDWITEAAREMAPRIYQQLGRPSPSQSAPVVTAPPPRPATQTVARPDKLPMPPPPGGDKALAARASPTLAPAAPTQFGVAKWVVAGLGAAALGTGIGFYGAAAITRSQLDSGSLPISSRVHLDETLQGISGLQTVSIIATAVGVAGLGAGTALFVLDQPTRVQVTVGPQGAGVNFAWELP